MTRTIATAAAIALLLACESEKRPAMGDGATGADGTTTDGGDGTTTGGTPGVEPGTTGMLPGTTAAPEPTTGTTCSFVCDTTGVGPGPGGPTCDNWAQDCPDGEKCAAWADDGTNSWNNLKCVPIEQNAALPGDPCTVEGNGVSGVDSCQLGAMCWDVDNDTNQGTCIALCTGSADSPACGDTSSTCVIANQGVLNLCLPKCDPLLQDCGGGNLCLPNPNDPNGFVCVLDASGSAGVAFDPCEYANACDKGFVCQDPALGMECDAQAAGCCLPFCDIKKPNCPGVGQDCLEWYEPGTAPPGYDNIGVCGIPTG